MLLDPQWNVLYWGCKWIFQTVCWDAVGFEWGTTSVYFGITYVCFIPARLPVFTLGPQYQHLFFVKIIFWRTHIKTLKKSMHGVCRTNIWSSWELLPFEVFFSCLFDVLLEVTYVDMLVATQWLITEACTSPHLPGFVWYGGLKAHWGYPRYV